MQTPAPPWLRPLPWRHRSSVTLASLERAVRWFESARDSNLSGMEAAAQWSRTLVALNVRAQFLLGVPKKAHERSLDGSRGSLSMRYAVFKLIAAWAAATGTVSVSLDFMYNLVW